MKFQRCYNNVLLLDGIGPSLPNVERIDLGAAPMIARMCRTGLRTDLDHFVKMSRVLADDKERITEEVRGLTGYYCNLDSGDQVADLLFKKVGLKQARQVLTSSGDRESVEHQVLVAIQHNHPAVPKILEFKEISKLKGTYVDPMPKLAVRIGPDNWRMMPKLGQTRVPAGRLNCKEPNLLAMPTRTKRGREIRKGFIASKGRVILSVDLSQIEPRVVAHRSNDPGLIRVYREQEDLYSDYATTAFGLVDKRYKDPVTGKWKYPGVDAMNHRRPSKICILAAFYDVTNVGLLEQMPVICKTCGKPTSSDADDVPLHDCGKFVSLWNENNCQDLLNALYMKYTEVLQMRKADHKGARKHAMMWCMWGRILQCAAVRSVLDWVVSKALREIGNFPMSSGAQGVIKLAMAKIEDDFVRDSVYDVCDVILQVHDELLFDVEESLGDEIAYCVVHEFENAVRLRVPTKASSALAGSWGDLEK